MADKISKTKAIAQKIIDSVKTPEMGAALKGKERGEYLDALDVVYGDRATRAKDLGFGDDVYYHGTKYKDAPIEKFRESGTKQGDVAKYGKGVYVTPSAGYADQYAGHGDGAIYPVRLKNKDSFNPADAEEAKKIIEYAGFNLPVVKGRLRSTEEGLDLLEKASKENNVDVSGLLENANKRINLPDDGIAVARPNEVRSTNAAFDPRFKDSANILALNGGSAYKNPISGALNPATVAKKIYESYSNMRSDLTNYIGNKVAAATDITAGAPQGQAGRDAVAGLSSGALDFITPDVMDAIPLGKVASATMRMANKVPQIKRVSDTVNKVGGALGMASKGANLEGKSVFGSKPTNYGNVATPDMPKQQAFTQEMRDVRDRMMVKHADMKKNDPAQYQEIKQARTDYVRDNWDTVNPKKITP